MIALALGLSLSLSLSALSPSSSADVVPADVAANTTIVRTSKVSPAALARRIDRQERVELGSVSYDGHLGDSSVDLIALETLGDDVLPYLIAMSSSKSPVARVVAAAGLRVRPEPIARTILSRLEHDDATVDVMRGCGVDQMSVGEAVRDLAVYEILIRPRV